MGKGLEAWLPENDTEPKTDLEKFFHEPRPYFNMSNQISALKELYSGPLLDALSMDNPWYQPAKSKKKRKK